MTTSIERSLRPELPPLPARIAKLPVDKRGYPVPWFVAWVDGEPEFRAADGQKLVEAIEFKRCWVCGDLLGHHYAFTIGPMCAVNRISSEPPSHLECAEFSVKACPFLSRPHMRRRDNDLPESVTDAAGVMLKRNPGVTLIWVTKSYGIVRTPDKRFLIRIGEPKSVACYAEGRAATIDEIRASVESGYPLLLEQAQKDGDRGVRELERQAVVARRLLKIA